MEKLADRTGKQSEVKEKTKCHHGIEMSPESKAEWEFAFLEIEESIEQVMKEGEDL